MELLHHWICLAHLTVNLDDQWKYSQANGIGAIQTCSCWTWCPYRSLITRCHLAEVLLCFFCIPFVIRNYYYEMLHFEALNIVFRHWGIGSSTTCITATLQCKQTATLMTYTDETGSKFLPITWVNLHYNIWCIGTRHSWVELDLW